MVHVCAAVVLYPLASRLDLYRSAHDLLEEDYDKIQEYSLYYDSCLEWEINDRGFTLLGYGGKVRRLVTTPIDKGVALFKSEWEHGMVGTAYTTLTDNKTFMFTAACFEDNQMSWNVFSTKRTLKEETKQKIYAHARELGYKPEFFTEIRYNSCKRWGELGGVGVGGENGTVAGGDQAICEKCQRTCPSLRRDRKRMQKYKGMCAGSNKN